MKCFFCENLLSDYTEGILDGQLEQEVKNHLENCPKCLDSSKKLKNLKCFINNLGLMNLEDNLYDDVKKTIIGKDIINKSFRTLFIPFKIKFPLFFLTTITIILIVFFAITERNKNIFLSKLNIEMFQPQVQDNVLTAENKEEIMSFAKDLKPLLSFDNLVKEKLLVESNDDPSPIKPTTVDNLSKQEKKEIEAVKKNIEEFKSSTNRFLYKFFSNSNNINLSSEQINKLIAKYDIVKISGDNNELDNSGAYFHLYVNQDVYDDFLKDLKSKMKIVVERVDSDRVVTNNRNRVIIWIENLRKKSL